MHICYSLLQNEHLDYIRPLWEKLRDHHAALSPKFGERMRTLSWEQRKQGLLEKSEGGQMRIDCADDTETGLMAGYCISTVSIKGEAEIDSLFIEKGYRRCGIGNSLMKNALAWIEETGAYPVKLEVIVGNEEAFRFYEKFGFFPRSTVLEQLL